MDLVAWHEQAGSLAQCDDAMVAKIKTLVDASFHVWLDAVDAATKAAADQMVFRKKWL